MSFFGNYSNLHSLKNYTFAAVIRFMVRYAIILLLILFSAEGFSQIDMRRGGGVMGNTSNRDIGDPQKTVIDDREKPPIEDYKIISVENDTTYVDTTLTIYKDYKFNYLRKDNFELLSFANVGHAYTSLAYDFDEVDLLPDLGARAKHFSYYEVDDIFYYHVPTPLTELFFKTTFEQGQNVNAFFTTNMTPRLNISIAYRGLRSLGKYQHVMASQGAFRFTVNYQTKNNRYDLKTHFVSQDTNNEENGGLTRQGNINYRAKEEEFDDRSLLPVNFKDAENMLYTKRFFLKHHYNIVKGNDSTENNQIRIGHELNFTDKEYWYSQNTPFAGLGASYKNTNLRDEVEYQRVSNLVYAQYRNTILGEMTFQAKHSNYNYGYGKKLILGDLNEPPRVIPNRLKGDVFSVGGKYKKKIGGFQLSGDAMINLSDEFSGNYLKANAGYRLDEDNKVDASLVINSSAPNFNFLLYQSDYVNYNWYNDFDNVQKQDLNIDLKAKKIANLSASLSQINNYTYFGLRKNEVEGAEADTLVTPYQYNGNIGYLKIKANRKFEYWRFGLDNTLMYQNVFSGESVFRVPDFVTRHSFYYEDYWFNKALYLNMGFTFNYFTSFMADSYDPVLAEFYVQNNQEIGGFYRADFFFNGKVDQTRIFFKLENFSTIFEGNNNYSAPSQPYRDFVIRFGLVWNFFL